MLIRIGMGVGSTLQMGGKQGYFCGNRGERNVELDVEADLCVNVNVLAIQK